MRITIASCISLGVILLFCGCTATSPYMTKATSTSLAPIPADKARIIIFRPTGLSRAGKPPVILTASGMYLGHAIASSHFFTDLKPGDYTFVVWGEGNHAMKASLKPGKTYYIWLSTYMGKWGPMCKMYAIKPGTTNWKAKDRWLVNTDLQLPDQKGGQAMLEASREEVKAMIDGGVANFAGYPSEEQLLRTLLPADGE